MHVLFWKLAIPKCSLTLFLQILWKIQEKIGLRNTLNAIFCMSKEYWVSCWYQFHWLIYLFIFVLVIVPTVQYVYVINVTSDILRYFVCLMFQLYKNRCIFFLKNVLSTSISFAWLCLPDNRHFILGRWVGEWVVGCMDGCLNSGSVLQALLPTYSLAYSKLMIETSVSSNMRTIVPHRVMGIKWNNTCKKLCITNNT